MDFARKTPPEVAAWLKAQLEAMPSHFIPRALAPDERPFNLRPILKALATDERMSDLYSALGERQPYALSLIALAVRFRTPTILSALQRPSEKRSSLSWPEHPLGAAAREFAAMLEWWSKTATELWGEPVDTLVERLRAFATAAFERGKAKQSAYDEIPAPDRRGRGDPEQLAFHEAFSRDLQRLFERDPLPKEREDRIIATIVGVVFPEQPVDAETIRKYRKRRERRQKRGDN